MLSLVHQHWIKHYGAMVRLHSDRDIRFTSEIGWWRNTFKAMAVEVTFVSLTRRSRTDSVNRKTGNTEKRSGS